MLWREWSCGFRSFVLRWSHRIKDNHGCIAWAYPGDQFMLCTKQFNRKICKNLKQRLFQEWNVQRYILKQKRYFNTSLQWRDQSSNAINCWIATTDSFEEYSTSIWSLSLRACFVSAVGTETGWLRLTRTKCDRKNTKYLFMFHLGPHPR